MLAAIKMSPIAIRFPNWEHFMIESVIMRSIGFLLLVVMVVTIKIQTASTSVHFI